MSGKPDESYPRYVHVDEGIFLRRSVAARIKDKFYIAFNQHRGIS